MSHKHSLHFVGKVQYMTIKNVIEELRQCNELLNNRIVPEYIFSHMIRCTLRGVKLGYTTEEIYKEVCNERATSLLCERYTQNL